MKRGRCDIGVRLGNEGNLLEDHELRDTIGVCRGTTDQAPVLVTLMSVAAVSAFGSWRIKYRVMRKVPLPLASKLDHHMSGS